MAVFHNSLASVGAPTQHDPLVAKPLQQRDGRAIQSVRDVEVEDVAQPWLYYISTDSMEEIFRSHREARAHDHKEMVMCVPVLATPELHRDLQARDRTGPRRYLCPELTKEWLQQNNLNLEREVRRQLAEKLNMQRQQEFAAAKEDNNISGGVLLTTETFQQVHTEPPTRAENQVPRNPITSPAKSCDVRRLRKRARTYAGTPDASASSPIDPNVSAPPVVNSTPSIIARTWTSSAVFAGRSFWDAIRSLPSMLLTLGKCVLVGQKGLNQLWLAALLFSLVSWTLLICNF